MLSVTLMWKTDELGSGSSVHQQTEPFYFGCECKSIVIRFHLGDSSDSSRPLDSSPPISASEIYLIMPPLMVSP